MAPPAARRIETLCLQAVVAVACVVPLFGGAAGMIMGAHMLGGAADPGLDSHVRYLSGLLFAVGIAFASTIPRIATQTARFRLLTLIVVCGGVARLAGFALAGVPPVGMRLALVMELVVTPALCLWQASLSRRVKGETTHDVVR